MARYENLTDAQLVGAYQSACAMAARLYAQGADTSGSDALVDALLEALIARDIA